jgi:paraquat-inducible protein B
MSSRGSNAAVGAFVIGALLLGTIGLLLVTGSNWGKEVVKAVMVFDGSVKGLSVGAPLAFRGVEIGQVTDIDLILDTESADINLLVEVQINSDNITRRGFSGMSLTNELIARGLRAQLNTQSLLTGLLYIQLDFHPGTELVLADIDSPYVQIPTIPSDLQRITREIEAVDFPTLAADLHGTILGIEAFVTSPDFQRLAQDLGETLSSLQRVSSELETQLAENGPQLRELLEGAHATATLANAEIPELSESTRNSLRQLDAAVASFRVTLEGIDYAVSEDSPTLYNLNQAIRELALAGRALRQLAGTLEAQPEALLRGKSTEAE